MNVFLSIRWFPSTAAAPFCIAIYAARQEAVTDRAALHVKRLSHLFNATALFVLCSDCEGLFLSELLSSFGSLYNGIDECASYTMLFKSLYAYDGVSSG